MAMSRCNRGNDRHDESYELEGRVETQTGKAWLIEFTNGKQCWVPKSQAEMLGDPDGNGNAVFKIRQWFAEKEGLA